MFPKNFNELHSHCFAWPLITPLVLFVTFAATINLLFKQKATFLFFLVSFQKNIIQWDKKSDKAIKFPMEKQYHNVQWPDVYEWIVCVVCV